MRQAADRRDGTVVAVDEVFSHAAFATLKDRNAAFVVVRADTREVLWANAAAASHWERRAEDLGAVLFGPPGAGWLGPVAATVPPGRPPQLFRTGLAPGFRMRGGTVLARALAGPDGATIVGLAVPETGSAEPAHRDAWRRDAATAFTNTPAEPNANPPSGVDGDVPDEDTGGGLARRGQFAVLRDRLTAAVDGAATLRFLWRTDAADGLAQIDDATFARLGAPIRSGPASLADAISRFDGAAAERLRSAFAGRETWSGIAVRLPVAEGAGTVPMTLSGSPAFGPERIFAGYRGFGMVDLGALEAVARGGARRAEPGLDTARPGPEAAPPGAPAETPARTEPASADPPAADAGSSEPQEAVAPPAAGHPPSGNVVDLRTFQAMLSGRPGVVASLPTAAEPLGDDHAVRAVPAPSDEQAFVALGEALRARLGASEPPALGGVVPNGTAVPTRDEVSAPIPAPPDTVAEAPPSMPNEAAPVPAAAPDPAAALLDKLPVPVMVLKDGLPAYANAAAAHLLGHPSSADMVAAGIHLVVSRTETGLAMRGGDGHEVAIDAEPAAVDWNGGAATLWSLGTIGRTVRPMPSLEPAVAATPTDNGEERSVELLDRVDDAVALLDGQGRIRRLNRRGQGWFDAPGAEGAIGQSFATLLAPESRAAGLQLLEEARTRDEGASAAPPRREILARTGDPAPVPMLLTMGRLGASGFYATLRDVTALKRAERDEAGSRRHREREAARLPDLLARVNHEIRTPLNAILGFAEVMMDERFGPLGSPRYRDYLKDIHASGTQVVTLVGDLLDLSRIEAGRLDLDVGSVDVNKVVAEIVTQMQPEAHRERVIVRTSLASRIPAAMADERSTRQIVQHLLSNAVKFNEPGGQVIVSTAQGDAGAVVLRIRDTGVGMTDAEIAAALEPFHDVSPPRPANGNGLGLPLARALVGANGASLSIHSRPREGTLVEVSFQPAPPDVARRPA